MRRAILFTICIALFCAGCLEQKEGADSSGPQAMGEGAAEKVTITGSTTVLPLVEAAAEAFNGKQNECRASITGGGTGAGITAIAEGRSNVAMASREVTSDELSKYGDKFQQFDIGYDGVVIIVSKAIYDAGIKGLSMEQVKEIYAGEIKNWKELGGPDAEIYAIGREQGSGTRDTFNEDIMADKKAETPGVSTTAMGSSEVKTAIVGSNSAIGYLGFSYLKGGNIEAIALDGIMPGMQTIKDGSYKLQRHLYLYTFGAPSSCAKAYIDFVAGTEGQKIAEENGFIPL
ncbi:MAG: phosphate ABC transporter substrate-binding protein [Methanotrichaceae archaeon]|nr:phosphate ABC transporter substrate-binding protein [Methanotrichaceae archaeon]